MIIDITGGTRALHGGTVVRRSQRSDRRPLARQLIMAVLGIAAALGILGLSVLPARAQSADRIDDLSIAYRVDTAGVLHVKERFVWRFGDSSGRHGINRVLVTREPDADHPDKDIVYKIDNFTASSPDPGVATDVTKITHGNLLDRNRSTTYRIGSPDRTVSTDTATYLLSYDVEGSLRSFQKYDELYWDATGFGNPQIRKLTITARVPGGPQQLECFVGPVRSTTRCDHQDISGDVATFRQQNLPAGEGLTIGVKIKSGLITDNTPQLERKAGLLSAILTPAIFVPLLIFLAIAVGAPIIGWRVAKSRTTDLRYLDLPPGTMPLAGSQGRVGKDDGATQIPVVFTPPKIPVAEAGILVDGQVDVRDTAATLIDLAVKGAIKIEDSGDGPSARLLDPDLAGAPHETVLLTEMFDGQPPGAVADLTARGSLAAAHKAMTTQTREQARLRGWFTKVPKSAGRSIGAGWLGFLVVGGYLAVQSGIGAMIFVLIFPLVSLLITSVLVRRVLKRGQRTPDGRAVCDQVEGFRQYLATAEAEQLQFEEGQDIFSRYLPWAIAFDLADRWQRICQRLVDLGRLPDQTPYWYAGPYHNFNAFNIGFLTGSLATAATPAAPSGGSGGTGFGSGGSSFSGGFAGGGGGGGGSSSW